MENNKEILSGFISKLDKTTSLTALEELETTYLGRNGLINEQLQKIKDVDPSQRKEFGQQVNELKKEIIEKLLTKKTVLNEKAESSTKIDITLPGKQYPKGSLQEGTFFFWPFALAGFTELLVLTFIPLKNSQARSAGPEKIPQAAYFA